ncbi:hypothetical protein [Carnobacterium mobile]|uniref:hypothetical protein n=1 Tax=Carnobacterium mobile TaxID=2750 RepID=UPI000AA19CEF|nr:hypothetical protein [Carnobacterium mobile]
MKKKMTIQEFNQDYMLINEQQMLFEDYPEKAQFDYIRKHCYHEENIKFTINYMGMLSDIRMGEPGSHRMDGVPFGYNAFRFIIEAEV